MNKLEKLEDLINKLLLMIGSKLSFLIGKVIPRSVFIKIQSFNLKIKSKVSQVLAKIKNKLRSIPHLPIIQKAKAKIVNLKSFPLEEKALALVQYLKTTPLNTYIEFAKKVISKVRNFISYQYQKLSNQQIGVAILFFAITGFGALSVFYSGNDIYQEEFVERAPASVFQYSNRPEYRNFDRKSFKVFNVKIPVFVESVREVKTITVDFSIRASNRFTKKFLSNYEYKLKDYFFTTVEPVISTFPLKEEGKSILKDKIIEELNTFLEEQGVEGSIEEVNIIFIVGS